MREMKLQDLKAKNPAELVSFAEELEVENASTMRKQELMFGILKQLAVKETDIIGEGVVEVRPHCAVRARVGEHMAAAAAGGRGKRGGADRESGERGGEESFHGDDLLPRKERDDAHSIARGRNRAITERNLP